MLARKRRFDDAYRLRTYDLLEHERIPLPEEAGTHFAAIGLISTAKFEFQPRESTFVSLNVLPLRRKTELLLSFLVNERELALPFLCAEATACEGDGAVDAGLESGSPLA